MNDNLYTLGYAAMVCFVCSILLSAFAMGLKPAQEKAALLDLNTKILSVFSLTEEGMSSQDVETRFADYVKEVVIDQSGKVYPDIEFGSLKDKDKCAVLKTDRARNSEDCKLSLYQKVENGQVTAVAIPIVGKGLWSTLYGYMALEKDANTVAGITFYKHGETPGLGAEIDQKWFTDNFVGKKVLDASGSVYGVTVAKGKAEDSGLPAEHVVDGISGATITANGVTDLVKDCVQLYEPYLAQLRKGGV